MSYNQTEVSFETLQELAIQAAPEMEEEILSAETASWVIAEQERVVSHVVGDENNFGVYVGSKHTLRDISGPIWVNFTK